MNIAEASIRYKTITIALTLLIIGGGLFAYEHLGRLEDPEFTIKDAQIFTLYPGASATEVAEEVTDAIETAIQQMGQVDRITSISEPGKSTIRVTMLNKYDKRALPQIWDELRRKVNDVQGQLPPGCGRSIVYDDFGDVYGVFYAVYGDGFTYADLKQHADLLRRELLLCDDVGKIALYGVQDECVYVEVSRARLAQLGVSPDVIYASLAGQNLVTPAGRVVVDGLHLRLEPSGQLRSVQDIGDVLVLTGDASRPNLHLRDVAVITRGYRDPPVSLMQYNGRPAIGLGISTVAGGNVITMGRSVDARLRELQTQTPVGIEVGVIAHQADAVHTAVSGFVVSLIEAIAIVVGVLMLAMGLRSGLLIGLILLLTVLATFMVMYAQGVILERISLGALIIALGMLVDNAIVVVEGILVNLQRGMDRVKAAAAIVGQTIWPLLGATVVAVLAFAAIGASQDSTGEYCRSLFLVILYSLMLSWLLAITVTPLLGVWCLKVKSSTQDRVADPYGGLMFTVYRSLLMACLRWRWATVAVLAVLMALAVWGFGFVDKSFFPDSTRPQFMVHYWLPEGTHIEVTQRELARAAEHVRSLPGVTDVGEFAGQGALRFLLTYSPQEADSSYGLLLVSVEDYPAIDSLSQVLQGYLSTEHPNAQAYTRRFVLGPGDPQKIHARFRGPDADVLRGLTEQARQIMLDEPHAVDVMDDWRQRVPLVRPVLATAQARNAGVTRADVAAALEVAYGGRTIGVYREQDDLLPIIARAPKVERNDVVHLEDVRVFSPVAGRAIPIRQVIRSVETTSENRIIRRRDRQSTITVKCDPIPGVPASEVLARLMPRIEAIPLPVGYTLAWGGEYEDSGKAQAALAGKIPVVLLLMILTVLCLFNSVRHTLIIWLTVPMAVIGVTAGLLAFGQPFGFMALLGFMSLTGMLIKNAIVLIDEIDTQVGQGKDRFVAVVESGISRVRPVSLAAITTVLGMLPLLTDAFFVAMAVTIMVGLSFATVLTLLFVPVLYVIIYRVPYPRGQA